MGLLSFLRAVAIGTDGGRTKFVSGPVERAIATAAASSSALSLAQVHSATVTRDFALAVPAVLRGRNVICSIATLPLVTIDRRSRERLDSPLLAQIDPQVPNLVTLAMTLEDLIFDAVAWWRITRQATGGYPVAAQHIESYRVSTRPPSPTAPNRLPSGIDPASVVWLDGEPVDGTKMIRFDSPNPALLQVGRRSIKRAALLDAAASMYAADPRPLGYLTPRDDADPDDDEVQDVLDSWLESRRRRATGWIPAAVEYHEVQALTPADLQLVALQQRTDLALANMLGLDPEDVGVSTTSRTYANATDRRRDKINDTLAPYMLSLTARLSMNDITRRAQQVTFDLTDYLKADPMTAANVASVYLDRNVLSAQEVRADLGRPDVPVESVPVAQPAPAASQSASRAIAPAQLEESRVSIPMTFSVAAATSGADGALDFDASGGLRHVTFGVEAARADFAVDLEKRTITGLSVPYGELTADGRQIRFAAGSIEPSEFPEPVLMSHGGIPVGVVRDTADTAAGQRAVLKISKTQDGDDALVLADDRAITGMSVGVDVYEHTIDAETGDITVTKAIRREISLTPFPAFHSARISKVNLHSRKGNTMPEVAESGTTTAAPAPVDVAALVAAEFARQSAQPVAAPQGSAVPVAPALPADFASQVAAQVIAQGGVEQREVVNPVRDSVAFQVREPLPYRFDGRRGPDGHDFSTDLFAAAKGRDGEAAGRLEKFMEIFDVAVADVDELNPARQRPDLWVDQKDYVTPIWDAIRKGTIPDATPFVVPKFSSASGLVGDHTQGTEPTSGNYVTTGQTIQPAPISGKVTVNREVIDQGGNPQISTILWGQIQRNYSEALESKAAAMLNALSAGLTTITITTGAANKALAAGLRSSLAPLQYVRGGFRFRDFAAQVDLYTALSAAQDDSGRPLFPAVGGQNADGSASAFWAALDVNGLLAVPAWALGATSTGSSKSWLFDRNDVHGWATPPNRLDFEYQVKSIELGVWGYQAVTCTDITGVRAIAYDPIV